MRIEREHRDELYDLLDAVRDMHGTVRLHEYFGDLRGLYASKVDKDLGKRVRWDMFWAIRPVEDRDEWMSARYAEGCNDSHVDSVLKEWMRLQDQVAVFGFDVDASVKAVSA